MELQLRDGDQFVCKMTDDEKPLGYYGVTNGMEIHVVDTDPFSLSRNGGLDDVSQIEKYRMADDVYDKKDNTLRAYKRKMQATNPNFKLVPSNRAPSAGDAPTLSLEEYSMPQCVEGLLVGQRVEVAPGARRGTIGYIGTIPGLAGGYWIGVALDEPLGKNDGTKGGTRYFECGDHYGSFVRPNFVTTGDFPPDDLGLDDDEVLAGAAGGTASHCSSCACGEAAAEAGSGSAPDSAATAEKAVPRASTTRPHRRRGEGEDSDEEL